MKKKIFTLVLTAMLAMSFAGCASNNTAKESSSTDKSNTESENKASGKLKDLQVRFGSNGKTFTLNLYNNDTAAEIARHVGNSNWNLPIYHFNDFDNYTVMQYYDIPSKYKITSKPETVTSEKAGELYYSTPNRVILFYQDAQVKGEFTKVGNIQNTDGLKEAVEKNSVVSGQGNKTISISPAK